MQCQACRREFADDEPVYRVPVGYSGPWDLAFHGAIGIVCGECQEQHFRWTSFREPQPCVNCGRPVILDRFRGKVPKRLVCGAECLAAVRASAERQRQSQPMRPCAVCGKLFQPKRSDALYCSPAHRQAAYRRRISN